MKLLSNFNRKTNTSLVKNQNACFELLTKPQILKSGWKIVRANKGAAGGDGITIKEYESNLESNIQLLANSLIEGTYKPDKLKHISINKKDGGKRNLSIPSIKDRIVQTATLLLLSSSFDKKFYEDSWGYRPGRGHQDAILTIEKFLKKEQFWIVDADIEKFFDEVPHLHLIQDLSIWIDDNKLLQLILLWLNSFSSHNKGLAQGSPISPLLSNIYLHPLDRIMISFGFKIIRYADDFIILNHTKQDALRALTLCKYILNSRGLKINESKTKIIERNKSFEFLGHHFNTEATNAE
jgi:CRISPR-associated protein Cas1